MKIHTYASDVHFRQNIMNLISTADLKEEDDDDTLNIW